MLRLYNTVRNVFAGFRVFCVRHSRYRTSARNGHGPLRLVESFFLWLWRRLVCLVWLWRPEEFLDFGGNPNPNPSLGDGGARVRMGEAEAKAEAAAVETLTEDGSEAGKGGGAGGGSLPPRKRLLNSLKAGSGGNGNGSSGGNDKSMGEGAGVEGAAAVKQEDCVRCGSKENSAWRRVKKSGVYQRLCNSCTLHYSLNMFCPYCLVVYQDAGTLGDPAIWLNCCNCRRSVHIVCEVNSSASVGTPDPNAYVCPECRKSKELPNGAVAKGKNKAAAGDSTSPASPTHKKPRTGRESRPNDGSEVQVEKVEGGLPAAGAKPSSSGSQEALTAAKNAAQLAQKAAAAAKATAAAKAQAAAKAAIAARAALEAAAQAARAEVHARAELRRNGVRMEPRLGFNMIAPKLDPLDKGKEESPAEDDEELARQLHRAMNSSPRVPRTPRRKPEGVSPGASPSAIEPKDEPGLHDSALQKQQQVMSRPAILRSDSAVKQEHNNEGLFEHPGMTEAVSSAVDTHGFPSTYLLNPESSDANNAFPFADILAGFPSHEMQAEEHGVTGMDVDGSAGVDEEGTSMEVDNSGVEGQGPQLGISISEGHVVLQGMPSAAGMLPESIVTEQQIVSGATEEMEELENKNESVMLEPNPEGAAMTIESPADAIIEGGSAAGENEVLAPLIAEAEIAGETGAEQQATSDHKHAVAEETAAEIAEEAAVEIAEEAAVEISEESAVAKAEDAAATLKEGDLPLSNKTDNTDTPFFEVEGGKSPDGQNETSGKWNQDVGVKISEEVKGDIVSGQVGGDLKDEKHQTETGHQAGQVIAEKEENDGDTRPATEDVQMPAASVDKGTKVEGSVGEPLVVDSGKETINGSDGKTGDTVEVTGVPGPEDTMGIMSNGAHPDNPGADFEVAKVSDMDEDAMKVLGTLVSGKQQEEGSLGDVEETQDVKLADTDKSLFSDDSQQPVHASGDQAVLKDRE